MIDTVNFSGCYPKEHPEYTSTVLANFFVSLCMLSEEHLLAAKWVTEQELASISAAFLLRQPVDVMRSTELEDLSRTLLRELLSKYTGSVGVTFGEELYSRELLEKIIAIEKECNND